MRTSDSGTVDSVFSSGFSSSPRSEMYQAWVFPDIHPNERQPVLSNWDEEDMWAFCGITCIHEDTWFDRTICPEPCGTMHTYCSDCGVHLGYCPHYPNERN